MTNAKTFFRAFLGTAALAALIVLPASAQAQATSAENPGRAVDAGTRAAVIEKVVQQLNAFYIDLDLAGQMEKSLREKLRQGAYDALTEQAAFLSQVTRDLRAVSHDLHLGVWPIERALDAGENSSEEEKQRLKAVARYNNNGFMQVARLHGNVGYLELSYFEDVGPGGETAVAAMNWLADSDALIIDVRRNGGGSDVVRLVESYLFPGPVHVMDSYSRVSKTTTQQWTMDYVPGRRLADIPVYILQSRRTASAAERLAYSLKNLRRATLVGEVSRGAANPVEEFSFPELKICMAVSAYKVQSPVTGTSWEGVGVVPDIDVPAEKALDAACVEAMKTLLKEKAGEDITQWRTWALEMYQALFEPVTLGKEMLAGYLGSYGPVYSVTAADGHLNLKNNYAMPMTLIPLGEDRFAFKEEEGVGRFTRDQKGVVIGLEIRLADGYQTSLNKGFKS